VIKRQSPENQVRIKQHMRDRVAQYRQADGGYAVPSDILVVAGRKPG
jgi:hypothetical protein